MRILLTFKDWEEREAWQHPLCWKWTMERVAGWSCPAFQRPSDFAEYLLPPPNSLSSSRFRARWRSYSQKSLCNIPQCSTVLPRFSLRNRYSIQPCCWRLGWLGFEISSGKALHVKPEMLKLRLVIKQIRKITVGYNCQIDPFGVSTYFIFLINSSCFIVCFATW